MADLEISFDEAFSIAETRNQSASRANEDVPAYSTWESQENWTINQNWLWHETWAWNLDIKETLKFVETYKKDVSANYKQTLTVVDKRPNFEFTLNHIQPLKITDALSRSLKFYRRMRRSTFLKNPLSNTTRLTTNRSFSLIRWFEVRRASSRICFLKRAIGT